MIKVRRKRSEKEINLLDKVFGNYEDLTRPVVIKEIPQTEEEMEMIQTSKRKIWEKIEEYDEGRMDSVANLF